MDDEHTTFSAREAVAAQEALRAALGLGPEAFPLEAFVGMISDEIESFRDAGRSEADVAEIIERATGRRIAPEDLARLYAPPEWRRGGEPD